MPKRLQVGRSLWYTDAKRQACPAGNDKAPVSYTHLQDTPQKAVHKFVGDAAQKIVQNIVGGAVQKTVQNIVEDIVQNTEDTEQNTVENTTEENTQVSSLTAAQNVLADNTNNKEGEHVSGWKSC